MTKKTKKKKKKFHRETTPWHLRARGVIDETTGPGGRPPNLTPLDRVRFDIDQHAAIARLEGAIRGLCYLEDTVTFMEDYPDLSKEKWLEYAAGLLKEAQENFARGRRL